MHSLRSRLTLTHMLVALVAVVVVAGLTSVLIQRGFDNLADRQARADAIDVADRLGEFYQRRSNWRGLELLMRRRFPALPAGDPAQRRRIQVLDEGGAVIFDSAGLIGARRAAPLENAVREPVTVDGRTVGMVLVSSARDELSQAEREFLARVRLSVLIGSVSALAAALLAGLVSAAGVTRPLRSLTEAARRLASGARHEPLAVPADVELAELATTFNTMAAELERQEGLRRQQVADIAHELRTPLSVLRLQIESMADGVEQPTPQLLGSLNEEVGLLARLVDDLRLLSLAEAGQLSMQVEKVDAADAIRQAVSSAQPRARQQGMTVRVELPERPLSVAADPQRLAQVLGNLIENALRYSPAGGSVTLSAGPLPRQMSREGAGGLPGGQAQRPGPVAAAQLPADMVMLSVSDTGPGIAPEDLERIFDRFWRADRARTRVTGGSGLGLAIVRRLVELQGGRVWATSVIDGGTTFYVALPAASVV